MPFVHLGGPIFVQIRAGYSSFAWLRPKFCDDLRGDGKPEEPPEPDPTDPTWREAPSLISLAAFSDELNPVPEPKDD